MGLRWQAEELPLPSRQGAARGYYGPLCWVGRSFRCGNIWGTGQSWPERLSRNSGFTRRHPNRQPPDYPNPHQTGILGNL